MRGDGRGGKRRSFTPGFGCAAGDRARLKGIGSFLLVRLGGHSAAKVSSTGRSVFGGGGFSAGNGSVSRIRFEGISSTNYSRSVVGADEGGALLADTGDPLAACLAQMRWRAFSRAALWALLGIELRGVRAVDGGDGVLVVDGVVASGYFVCTLRLSSAMERGMMMLMGAMLLVVRDGVPQSDKYVGSDDGRGESQLGNTAICILA